MAYQTLNILARFGRETVPFWTGRARLAQAAPPQAKTTNHNANNQAPTTRFQYCIGSLLWERRRRETGTKRVKNCSCHDHIHSWTNITEKNKKTKKYRAIYPTKKFDLLVARMDDTLKGPLATTIPPQQRNGLGTTRQRICF